MSNEKIDEFLSWRGRLDGPQGVPGQGLDDREATWERLMDRIAGTSRRRRFFRYRVAVACVLLAMVPGVRFLYDRYSRVAVVRPMERRRIPDPAAMEHLQAAREHSPGTGAGAEFRAMAVVSAGRAKQAVKEGKPVSSKRPSSQPSMHEQAILQRPALIAGVATPPAAMMVTIPGSPAPLTLNSLKSKPLRVVHINELPEGPGASPAAVTASDADRHFEFFLMPGQSRLALPPPPPAAEAALLKVKLSSSN